ncbi:hypothetical protein Anas_10013 [Armadillidium nasatum]|uniref:SPOC domain-containing protein n=1 Tax=Armadillidium nasatum TaxID=96803 RepID=A0A5N5TER4_9CRUS|nr:hypothetical protein Anas_10013 [Armadillidium nasatum]
MIAKGTHLTGVSEMRGCILGGKRLQVDFASRECQVAFYENLNKQEFPSTERTWERRTEVDKFERSRREGSYIARQLPTQRIQNYTATRTRNRYEGFEEYNSGRNFEEFADNSFERDLHEYAGRQRYENGPSTSTHTTTTNTTTTTTVKHRSFSPVRSKRDDKSPISPRSIARDSENASPLVRIHDDLENRRSGRHRSTSDHDSFHSQSPPPRGRNSVSRVPSQSPSTPIATSPSREVTVIEDPRRRRPSDFKDLVVRVSDMRRPSNSPVRHRNSSSSGNHRVHSDVDIDEGDSFAGKNELHDPRLNLRREDLFSSGDERSVDEERPPKKQKFAEGMCGTYEKSVKRNSDSFEFRQRDQSPGFRKPFDSSRKSVEGKFGKRENNRVCTDELLRSPQPDPRHRKSSVSDIDESSPWRARDISLSSTTGDGDFLSDASPPGTPVRDEREDPPAPDPCNRRTIPFSIQREKNFSPLSLPLPKFAQQIKLHLSPRGTCSSPRGGSLLRSPTFNTGTNWNLTPVEVNSNVEESDPILADTPVSPGPALHDSPSDSEESPSVSPTNMAGDLYERIKALDEKYEKWTGSARSFGKSPLSGCRSASASEAISRSSFTSLMKKRILDLEELKSQEPSDIMKSLLSKRSVFDEDSERLENISDKYEPRPFSSMSRSKIYSAVTTTFSVSNSSSGLTNTSTCTTLPVPSATPLNSLPGIRRTSTTTSASVSSPQAAKSSYTPTSTVVCIQNSLSLSRSNTFTKITNTAATHSTALTTSAVTVSFSNTTTTTTTTTSSVCSSTSVMPSSTNSPNASASVHSRLSTGSSVSTPGPPVSSEDKVGNVIPSSSDKLCDSIVTVIPDTRVTGAVSVIQTTCNSKSLITTTTQAITSSSSSVQQPSPLDSSLKLRNSEEICKSPNEGVTVIKSLPEKKVLIEKEQVQNTSLDLMGKETTFLETNKVRVKDHYNHCSVKSETVISRIKNEPEELLENFKTSEQTSSSIHKRRLSLTDIDSADRKGKHSKEFFKVDTKSFEPENKKIKLEQEEEKENKSIKNYREKDLIRIDRKERTKSGRREESKDVYEDKGGVQSVIEITTTVASVLSCDTSDIKTEVKSKREEKLDVKEKPQIYKSSDLKEEKIKDDREKRKDKLEEKSQYLHKHNHNDKYKTQDKSAERRIERQDDKKEVKSEYKEEKDEKEEKKREHKEDYKIDRKEEREEKLKDYERRRHSEEAKTREDRKDRNRDRKERDKLRDRERHRSNLGIHSEKDVEREKRREKEKQRQIEFGKEKEKQKHNKSSKVEERLRHHSDKKERRDTLSSISSPSDHSSLSSYSEKSSKTYSHKPTKRNSQSSLEQHEDDLDGGINTLSGHKPYLGHNSNRGKESTTERNEDFEFQEKISRKKHDSGKSDDKSKSHSSQRNSHYPKIKSSLNEDDGRGERDESEVSSEEEKTKPHLQPAKRTKQRATSSSSGSRRGRPKNKSILDTESESVDTESDSENKPKKPSYFEITIYDGNMYDKVKARRVKSNQKQDDDIKQQKLKQKLLQQRTKRSKKTPTRSCIAIQSESEDSDTEIPKKRGHARIHSSSEEESYIRSRTHLSSEESDSLSLSKHDKSKKKLSKDLKLKKSVQKVMHVSDITTDEETVSKSVGHLSGTESDIEPRFTEKSLKIESEEELSETGNRKPPRPALSASRNHSKERDKVSLVDKTHLYKESKVGEEETDVASVCEDIRLIKPKLRESFETINSKSDKRKYSDTNLKEKDRKEGRMKAIFGLMSDDSDSNAPPSNLSITSPDLVSATSYRKDSASSGTSSDPLHMTPPNPINPITGIYESDIDDDFRPVTPDLPSQKKSEIEFESSVIEKSNLNKCNFESSECMKDVLEINEVEKEALNQSWKEDSEQAVKETVCETSRAASDSGKGSSSGVSTASSSSGSSAEELLLLETGTGSNFREEVEINNEKNTSKNYIFERERDCKESIPRKDKKKKKKHKDKESSRSHRHSSNKTSRESHSHPVDKKTIEENSTHHFKLGSVKESSPLSRNDKTLVNNLSSNSTVSENISLEKTQRESNCSFENITAANKSPPLDMPIIKPDEIEVEPEPIETAVEEKTHKISVDSENAVQSISSTDEVSKRTQPIYEITESLSSPPQACPVEEVAPKASRSTISQEETLNAVAGLLACYNYYQEETSPNQTDDEPILHSESTAAIEDPIEQSEEAQKAAQMLQSEIGVEREPEDRDDSWEEPLPLNETDENIDESPAIMTSPEHSDNISSQTDPKKTEELQLSHEEHEHNDTPAKEPLQFPDSPSSVQSEPALQIDEDEQIETLDTSITEEKVNVVREVAALPQERSSVWNTPESDIQEGKPLGLTEESLENKNVGSSICEVEKSSESTSVPVSAEKYNSSNEADVIQENETSNFPSDEAPKVDDESNPYSKTACDTMLTTVDNCSASVNSESMVDKDIKGDIKLSDSLVPEIKSECSSNLDTVKEEPNDLGNDSFLPDSKENITQESNKTVENVVKKSEELIAASNVVSGDEKCMEISIEEKDRRLEGVLNSETECKNESMISDSQGFHTPSKSSEDLNTSVESSTTEMSTPEKDFKLEEPEIRNFTPRGRARGRGRRGCRRVVDNASSAVMSTILTRSSSANAKNSKPRGRGRSIRNTEIGEEEISGENITPEQPRRSTRMKRARKHPDMVEHDETTNRRKRGGRNGKTSGEDVGLRTSLSSSDVYDFHDSDEGEIEVALSKKGQKRETNKPPTPRSPSKLSEEVPDIHDSAGNTRKSRRLREKNLDDDPNLQTAEGDLESETPPAPLTRSRGRIKKDNDDDDVCNTPRKSPRSRIKINENDQEPSRDNPTGNESSISEVVIQKIESPVNSIIPPVSVPAKTIIIPCSTTKVFTTSIPTITSQITAMNINAIPSVYSSTVSSHPVKLSIVPAGLRNVSKVTPATCMISSNSYSVTSAQSSAVTVTSVPVSSQIQMENFVTQNIPFAVTSTKEIISNPVKSVVPINCNSIPPSAFKTFPNGKKPDTIPTPLVDPVTGHLTPMKMSDEGHYIPIADHLSLANKDKLNQPLHQAKVLKVFPSSITVTTITNSNPSVTVSIPSCTVSTLVSPIRAVGISSLAKGAAVTSLASRGNEISVELVSRPRPSVPPPSTANILLSSPKGIPNYNTKSPISITSSHTSTPPVTNSVIVSSHATVPQTNTPNIVTIATSNKIFSTSSSAVPTTTSSVATRGTVLSSTLAPIKGSIPAKIQPLPVAVPKATGSSQTGINMQNIILSSNNPHHPAHRTDYPTTQLVLSKQQQSQSPLPPQQQQQQQQQQPAPSSPAGPIGTVSLSRIPPVRSNAVVHEPHIQEFVSMVNPRYSEPNNSRYRESSIVEVARIQGGTPSALSPVPRNPEVEATHISSRTHYDMHAATPNALSRQGMRGSPSGPIPHVPAPVGSKGGLTHFYGEIHKKGGTPQPHPVVPPGVPVERYLASPPLHTPPSTQTPPPPPPAHHNTQRENLPINMYRTPYIVSDPRALYSGEKISNLSPMPMDLKVIEKTNHISDKGSQEDKDRPGVGPISISEFSSSRPGTVITPHNSTSPHHLPSPHYDRSTDSPQVTMMYNRRYYEGNIYPPNRSGTPGMEPESIARSPLSFATSALPPGEPHHSPRLQIAAPQFTPQVSPQMPPQADSFQYMLQNYPVMWDGILGLKNEQKQSLETGFIKYLGEDKKAAGIVNVHLPGSQQSAYVIHIFPPCEFANENLRRIAPELHGVAQTSRLLVIIATC